MSDPLQGWNIIPRGELHSMVQESLRWEQEFRERKRNACCEFYERIEKVKDNITKMKVLKEVAAKYKFREKWFMEQVIF